MPRAPRRAPGQAGTLTHPVMSLRGDLALLSASAELPVAGEVFRSMSRVSFQEALEMEPELDWRTATVTRGYVWVRRVDLAGGNRGNENDCGEISL